MYVRVLPALPPLKIHKKTKVLPPARQKHFLSHVTARQNRVAPTLAQNHCLFIGRGEGEASLLQLRREQ
jgi:hypothetical protein